MWKRFETDEELMRKLVEDGEEECYDELCRRYERRLERFCEGWLGNRQDAEDVTCVTLTKGYRNRRKYRGRYTFQTWIFRIATNSCIDLLRRKSNRSEAAVSADEIQSNSKTPPSELLRDETLRAVFECLQELPAEQRTIASLRVDKKMTFQAISEIVGRGLTTVHAIWGRTRQSLMRCLKRKGIRI